MRSLRGDILGPAPVRAASGEIPAVLDVLQKRMSRVATRIDDADSDARPGETTAAGIDSHQTLAQPSNRVPGKPG